VARPLKGDAKRVLAGFRLPPDLLAQLRALSKATDQSQSDIVIAALTPYLKRQTAKPDVKRLVALLLKQSR